MFYLADKVQYEYESAPYSKHDILHKYSLEKYKTTKPRFRLEDLDILNKMYYEYEIIFI